MRIVTGEDWVWTGYRQFFLTPDQTFPPAADLDRPKNGLVGANGDCAVIATGIHTGGVHVTVRACPEQPDLDGEHWEDVAETSVCATAGLYVTPGDAVETDVRTNLTPFATGPHRVRVHARGRMLRYDGSTARSDEVYLIQVWPAPITEDTSIKLGQAYAQQTGNAAR